MACGERRLQRIDYHLKCRRRYSDPGGFEAPLAAYVQASAAGEDIAAFGPGHAAYLSTSAAVPSIAASGGCF